MEQFGYSVDVVREHNSRLISHFLYQEPMSCKELSAVMGLSETAIKKNIVQLLDKGIVKVNEEKYSKKKNVGRQHIRYAINGDYGAFVLVDLSHRHDSFFIKDFVGNTLYNQTLVLKSNIYQKDILGICDIIKEKLAELKVEVKEIAVAIAGQINETTGEIIISSRFDSTDVKNVKSIFKDYFGIEQIFVKNDLRFSVFGDKKYMERTEDRVALYAYVGFGISCACVRNGKVIAGINDFAGEIGQCICGGGDNLHMHCAVDSLISKFNLSSFDELLSLYRTSPQCKEVVLQSAITLAEKIQPIANALGCVEILLLGEAREFGEDYLKAFSDYVNSGKYSYNKDVVCLDYKCMREYGMLEVLKNHIISLLD